ncbi:MAG: YceI family protein [Phaeodactylibacter sp.]|nr:YceI family protein [Phaeodactylibacter sp.]MCB9277203.1 YceI family protein [Lewinellaceae bacterium]
MSTKEATVAQKWAIDPAHTEVVFKVKHLVITTVSGTFSSFDGEVYSESDDFDGAEVSFQIDAGSISTNNTDRDNHLKSGDFFAVEQYPKITFDNGILRKVKGGSYKLQGGLTIRDVTRQVELDVDYNGTVKDPWGNAKAGFEISGQLNRKDFGLVWNAITEAGSMLVAEEVKLAISVQLAAA